MELIIRTTICPAFRTVGATKWSELRRCCFRQRRCPTAVRYARDNPLGNALGRYGTDRIRSRALSRVAHPLPDSCPQQIAAARGKENCSFFKLVKQSRYETVQFEESKRNGMRVQKENERCNFDNTQRTKTEHTITGLRHSTAIKLIINTTGYIQVSRKL